MAATSIQTPTTPRQNFQEGELAADATVQEATPTRAEEAFVADRQIFWSRFTQATTIAAGAIVVLLILMAIFLW